MKTIAKRISGMLVMASALLLCFSSCKEKENDVLVASIELEEENISVVVGQTQTLAYEILPENATNQNVIWESSDDAIATVSQEGVVSGIAPGTATITVTTEEGGKTDNCEVEVVEDAIKVTGVTVNFTSRSIKVGETTEIEATVEPADATNKNVTWSTSDESVATVEDGVITGVAAGNATITVTTEDGGFTADCEVTVTSIAVEDISLNLDNTSLKIGATVELVATVLPEDATNKEVEWSSDNTVVATVDNGIVTGLSEGTAVIKATTVDGNMSASCTVRVVGVEIYAAGSCIGSDWMNYPFYWINGTPYQISEEYGDIRGIASVNGELWLTGNDASNQACYWVDGIMTSLNEPGYATILTSEDNYYIINPVDYSGFNYWKNSGSMATVDGYSTGAVAYGMMDGKLYAIVQNYDYGTSARTSELWCEDGSLESIGEAIEAPIAFCKSGSDMYYLGSYALGEWGPYMAAYWKNDESGVDLCDAQGPGSDFGTIQADGSDIYIGMGTVDASWMPVVKVYKNGEELYEISGTYKDMKIAGGNVYVLVEGYDASYNSTSEIYKDGELLYSLESGNEEFTNIKANVLMIL